jgi:hypothetical protein
MKKALLLLLFVACSGTGEHKLAVWSYPYLMPMKKEAPAPEVLEKTISMTVTPGEFEPAAFAVRASGQTTVGVTLEWDEGDYSLQPAWCELSKVESLSDSTEPNRLRDFSGPQELSSGRTQFFWLTVHPPENTLPGTYTGRVQVKSGSFSQELYITCEVLPFRLAGSPVRGGAFMWLVDLPTGWYKDMQEHGIDGIQFFTWEWAIRPMAHNRSAWAWDPEPIKIENRDGRLVLDFSAMDRIMGETGAAGMKGPVVISLGNDFHMFYECRIAEKFGLPVDTVDRRIGPPLSPKLDSLFVEGLRQIRDHWREKSYTQELEILIYDEPTHGLLARGKNRYDLIKKNFPEIRVYGVVMDKRELAEQVQNQCDIIVANGDFDGCREVARKYGKGFYVYGSMGPVNYARFRMGCLPWRAGSQGAFFWMYNYWFYSPDGCAVYMDSRDPNRLVRSTQWECIREGIDDLRYFATAESLLVHAPAAKKESAQAQLEMLRTSIDTEYDSAPPEGKNPLEHYNEPQRIRDQVIEIIFEVL